MNNTFEELKAKCQDMDADKAVATISDYLKEHPNDDKALTLRGMKYWSLGDRSQAINDYLAAIKINPDSQAKMLMKSTYDILDFYNKDLYNP